MLQSLMNGAWCMSHAACGMPHEYEHEQKLEVVNFPHERRLGDIRVSSNR